VAEETHNPVFDERALAKLLEAAYVVQEHNRQKSLPELRPPATSTAAAPLAPERTLHEVVSAVAAPVIAPPVPEPTAVAPPSNGSSSPAATNDLAATISQIVEMQRQMQMQRLAGDDLLLMLAQRLAEIVQAAGSAIGILEEDKIRYRAVFGQMTPGAGSDVARDLALCVPCLRTGQALRCPDIEQEFLIDIDECRHRGVQSMFAVPVFSGGAVSGSLELYYAVKHGFDEHDVHGAQLMASLVTEALAREEELSLKKSLANERAVMLEALEKLKPNLAALVDASLAQASGSQNPAASGSIGTSICRKCSHRLLEGEHFCGKCGTPRSGSCEPPAMQSKTTPSWPVPSALEPSPLDSSHSMDSPAFDDAEFEKMLATSLEKEMPQLLQSADAAGELAYDPLSAEHEVGADSDIPAQADSRDETLPGDEARAEEEPQEKDLPVAAWAKPARTPDWSSAASAREFFEQLAAQRSSGLARFWQARRGDFYLALAVILVACVIRWGIWSNHPVGATGTPAAAAAQQHRKAAADADLPWFDRVLVSLGLAEAPPPVEYKGNPQAEVWVDLQTALYYCPGADLYGKTPKGKFTTQRDAQLDQFESASRKACD
jgi:hypothetical protein